MTPWLEESVERMSRGTHAQCQLGHDSHDFTLVPIDLSNQLVPDFPEISVPLRFSMPAGRQAALDLTQPGYCPERGEVSRSLRLQAMWEGFETALIVQILQDSDDLVIDFGANLGWYTNISLGMGNPTLSIEADAILADALADGVRHNYGEDAPWRLAQGWIDENTPQLSAEGAPHVRLVKSDMEGAEPKMFRVIDELLETGKVDYVIFELTQAWADYEPAVERVKSLGYQLFVIPDKGYDTVAFAQDPLGCTKTQPLRHSVSKIGSQLMCLFVRGDLG